MSVAEKVGKELKEVGTAAAYFGAWIGFLVVLKKLVLAEYQIAFSGLAATIAGTLVLSKVVLILQHVPLGARVARAPAWVDILLRTTLYTAGVFVVTVLEKLVRAYRHTAGGWGEAWTAVRASADLDHAVATTLCLSGGLLVYNFWSVVRLHLASVGLRDILLEPVPAEETAPGEPVPSAS